MKILKYGPLVRRPKWPKVRMCQNCGSTIELERQDTKTYYIYQKWEECYRCPACYKYNLLDKTIVGIEEYQKFDEEVASQVAIQVNFTLDLYKRMSPEDLNKFSKLEGGPVKLF